MAQYQKLTHREHVLKRPESYAGSLEPEEVEYYNRDFEVSQATVSPIFLKIFDEIIVNVIDERHRNPKKLTSMDVSVTGSGLIKVTSPVPIPDESIEMIFGHLLTSSNFDDTKERYTGGKNGLGAKLTNIFSKKFKVRSGSKTHSWSENMSVYEGVAETPGPNTLSICFLPDYDRLGHSLDPEILYRRVFESALWIPRVTWNSKPVAKDNLTLEEFARMHLSNESDALLTHSSKHWDICISNGPGVQVSFVNGVNTAKGGTHIETILSKLVFGTYKKSQIFGCVSIFVKVLIDRPTFSSQTKVECTSKNLEPFEFSKPFLKKFKEMISDDLAHLELSKLKKKTDGKKTSKISGIPKLDDANLAGTKHSESCTLILTEGDSAKALAIAGLSVLGRDRYGVFPLRGKPRNVVSSTTKQIEANAELVNIMKILGLKFGTRYENLKSLRYGRVLIMTDADVDGSHITGLILNIFDHFWDSLLGLGYVSLMVTPVIKADSTWFFTEHEFLSSSKTFKNVKYYKGLGTSTSAEAREYFRMIDKLTVKFEADPESKKAIQLGFSNHSIKDRKVWLLNYMGLDEKPSVPYGSLKTLTITDFVHKDLVRFSYEDIIRSIGHLCDGLKPSQRKIIYAALKRNLTKDLSLVKFAGYVAEVSDYHHGEASLHGAIIGLAQDYIGSNNINLLVPSGQFGTRLEGGHDHASARYISTRLSPEALRLFDVKGGSLEEPEYYVPILPMVLVNGTRGIGTGFSSFIPPYNPKDLKSAIRKLLRKEQLEPGTLKPWYRGFQGTIEELDYQKYVLRGIYENGVVTELPPDVWIQDFKETLEKLVSQGVLEGFTNKSTETRPHFEIQGTLPPSYIESTIRTSNMYLVTPAGLKKYDTPEEILVDYASQRLKVYREKKKDLLQNLSETIERSKEKVRFIKMVIDGSLVIFRKSLAEIKSSLTLNNFSEQVLQTKTYEYSEDHIRDLETDVGTLETRIEKIQSITISEMWENDLLAEE